MALIFFTSLILFVGLIYSVLKDHNYSTIWLGVIFIGYHVIRIGTWDFLGVSIIVGIGLLIWTFGNAAFIFHSIRSREISFYQKLFILALGSLVYLPLMLRIVHWPFAGLAYISGIIPVLIFIILKANKQLKNSGHLTPYIVYLPICLANFCWMASFWFK